MFATLLLVLVVALVGYLASDAFRRAAWRADHPYYADRYGHTHDRRNERRPPLRQRIKWRTRPLRLRLRKLLRRTHPKR